MGATAVQLDAVVDAVVEAVDSVVDQYSDDDGGLAAVNYVDASIYKALMQSLTPIVSCPLVDGDSGFFPEGLAWVVSPVDGLENLSVGLSWACSVALVACHGQAVRPLVAVVYCAADHVVYAAHEDLPVAIASRTSSMQRLAVSGQLLQEGLAIFGNPKDKAKADRAFAMACDLSHWARDVKRIGPSSLDLVRVAKGACVSYADLGLGPLESAAGRLILEKSGGTFDLLGDLLLATNGTVRDDVHASARACGALIVQ